MVMISCWKARMESAKWEAFVSLEGVINVEIIWCDSV